MDGKETMLIGESTPFAMKNSEEMPVDTNSQGVTTNVFSRLTARQQRLHRRLHQRRKMIRTNIDCGLTYAAANPAITLLVESARSRYCLSGLQSCARVGRVAELRITYIGSLGDATLTL